MLQRQRGMEEARQAHCSSPKPSQGLTPGEFYAKTTKVRQQHFGEVYKGSSSGCELIHLSKQCTIHAQVIF